MAGCVTNIDNNVLTGTCPSPSNYVTLFMDDTLNPIYWRNTFQSLIDCMNYQPANGLHKASAFVGTEVRLGGNITEPTTLTCYDSFKIVNGNGVGFTLDPTWNFMTLGDNIGGSASGTCLFVDWTNNNVITQDNIGSRGIKLSLDGVNPVKAYLGDFDSNQNGTTLAVDDATKTITTSDIIGDRGLKVNFNAGGPSITSLGDYNNLSFGNSFIIDDQNFQIKTKTAGSEIGLSLDFDNYIFKLGDYNNVGLDSYLSVSAYSYFTNQANNSRLGINKTNPSVALDMVGDFKLANGSQGVGKVLTSDSAGLSTWTALPIPPSIQQSRVSTQFDKTNDTFSNITGLTANVEAGKTYRFEIIVFGNIGASGAGLKYAIGGTCTITNMYAGENTSSVPISTFGTTVASNGGSTTGLVFKRINGTITVNAAGTLTLQFAQDITNATPSSVMVGSTFVVTEMI